MFQTRWPWAVLFVIVGALQAWDSGVLHAPGLVQAIVAVAIVLTPAVWGMRASRGLQILSVVAAFVLLTVARVASPVPLPTLHLAAFIPAVAVLVLSGLQPGARRVES